MLSPAYLTRKLTSPIPTKDSGTLSTIGEACEYMAAIGKERELRPHWQRVRELMLQEADVAALSSRVLLAVLKDAKLDVTALSEPIEQWMDEPLPGLLSDGKLNVVEKDEPPTEPTESNERSDSDSNEERRRQEELQRAEARQAAEEERRREELQRAEARQAAEEERRREELQRAEARQAAEEQRRREELQRAEARRAAEEECRREELQRAEAAEEKRRREE